MSKSKKVYQFCESLQFDKKSTFNMNLAIVHKEKEEPMSFENEPNVDIINILYRCEPCNSSFETQII